LCSAFRTNNNSSKDHKAFWKREKKSALEKKIAPSTPDPRPYWSRWKGIVDEASLLVAATLQPDTSMSVPQVSPSRSVENVTGHDDDDGDREAMACMAHDDGL
jgi:hypothetical protein